MFTSSNKRPRELYSEIGERSGISAAINNCNYNPYPYLYLYRLNVNTVNTFYP